MIESILPSAGHGVLEAELDDLLIRWHAWQHGDRVTEGYNDRAAVVGDYLTSRQHDDTNGALYDAMDDSRSAIVEEEVDEMVHPWRTAIYVLARNLSSGVSVWNSPRLPRDSLETDLIVTESRRQVTVRLKRRGLL